MIYFHFLKNQIVFLFFSRDDTRGTRGKKKGQKKTRMDSDDKSRPRLNAQDKTKWDRAKQDKARVA